MSTQPGIVLVKEQKIINVQSAFPIMPTFQNFSLLATSNGQAVFTLPGYPVLSGLFFLNINGVAQDPLNGDYTVNGNVLTVNANLSIGDKVSGFYQGTPPSLPPTLFGYRTFFFIATAGQTQFNIGFIPQQVLYIAVNGTLQAIGENDYSVNGQIITMSSPLNAGDKFFGLAII